MTEAELIFTALAELSTRQIAESTQAAGMTENEIASKKGGGIAKKARPELEEKTRKNTSISRFDDLCMTNETLQLFPALDESSSRENMT